MNIWKGKVLSEVPFGHVLIVSGKIKPNPNKICLALTDNVTPDNEVGTVLLQIEANFRENQIIRSMYQPGEGWCHEEISKNWTNGTPKMPLVPGQNFNFRVAVLQKCFEIYVNEKIYGTFEHLESPSKIKYVVATGDFENITQFHHRMLFPLVFPKTIQSSDKECFQSDVPRKYDTGTVVTMEGIAKGPPNSECAICFQCNETGRVFMKFLVDFGNKTVVRTFQRETNRYDENDEERFGEFPFKRGKMFKIAFGLGEKSFLIAVNGKFFTYYNFPFKSFALSTIKCYCNEQSEFNITSLEYHQDTMSLLQRVEKLSAFQDI